MSDASEAGQSVSGMVVSDLLIVAGCGFAHVAGNLRFVVVDATADNNDQVASLATPLCAVRTGRSDLHRESNGSTSSISRSSSLRPAPHKWCSFTVRLRWSDRIFDAKLWGKDS